MSFDMSQFHQVFFEETAEHLAGMENLLLTLDVAAPDGEELNGIFRAAHSIKGSAGTFGFTDLADVTHLLENLLDRIRKGELALREDMIDAFLAAGDVLKNLLAAHRGEGTADRAAAAAIRERLRRLAEAGAAPPAPSFPASAAAPGAGLDLFFAIDGEGAAAEQAVEALAAELAALGAVRVAGRPAAPAQPWHLELVGAADPDAVRDLLEFVARTDSIRIAPLGTGAAACGDAADGAYGFFSDAGAAPREEAYGFFAPLPAPTAEPPAVAKPQPPVPEKVRAAGDNSIRVGVGKADQLINLVGELVITQAMLAQSAARLDPVEFERLHSGLSQLERHTRDLQEAVLSIRMLPMSVVFARFPRLVRDISQRLGKQVELRLAGEETELDKGLVERIADPLTHLVRNSLDHGIEPPQTRVALGSVLNCLIPAMPYASALE